MRGIRNANNKLVKRYAHYLFNFFSNIVAQLFLLVLSASIIFAFYYPIANSLKTQLEYAKNQFGLPLSLNLSNYIRAWVEGDFGRAFINNIILVTGVEVLTILVASLAAYSFSKMDFKLKKALFRIVLSFMFVSAVVISVSLYGQMVKLGLINTYVGAIIIYTAFALPFTIYVFTGFFRGIPNELLDSARIDGCSDFGIYLRVMLPLSKPVIATLFILNFIWVWNDLLVALLFLPRNSMQTLMVKISFFSARHHLDFMAVMAGVVIAVLPIVVLYMFAQRYFVRGMIAGALK